ncbi:MAG: S8 family serine peptidase [Phycisphaerales bacterium]
MKTLPLAGASVAILAASAHAGTIDPVLRGVLDKAGPDTIVSALLHFDVQLDIDELTAELDAESATRAERHRTVVRALQEVNAEARGRIVPQMNLMLNAGSLTRVQSFWLANAVRVEGPAASIEMLAGLPEVEYAYFNHPIELITPTEEIDEVNPVEGLSLGGTIEPGVLAVRAPEVWGLGFDGSGVLIATVDTGADGNHPALASRWAGLDPAYAGNPQWAWLDPYTGDNSFPFDGGSSSHGSHVTGSVVGGAPGDQIGVAPGAKWIAAGAIDRGGGIPQTVADAITTFEWLADPDGDPNTVWDVPHVASNSWGLVTSHGYPECDETFWSFIDALEAVGTVVLFAAGNEGDNGLRRPGDRALSDYRTVAVAATDPGSPAFPLADFSSRGPTACTPTGEPAFKPDIAGPGVNTRSALSGGGYGFKSGTSMATPHINGVVALIRQVNPDLSVNEVKDILYQTAVDLGDPGKDNGYGYGHVDAFEAVQLALGTVALTFDVTEQPEIITPNGGQTVRVTVSGQAVPPAPATGMLHWRVNGGPWLDAPMVEIEPNVYDAVFGTFECGDAIDWFVSAQNTDGEIASEPFQAPDSFFTSQAFTGSELVVEENFELEAGWLVVNEDLSDGQWDRGVPAGDGDRGDPTSDWDGSGSCWLTDNVAGNSDVDGGPTRLITPEFDLSGLPDPRVSFSRWFTNDDDDGDVMLAEISGDGGQTWVIASTMSDSPTWIRTSFQALEFIDASQLATVRVRFTVSDNPNDSITEAGIDAFSIQSFICESEGVFGDITGDGEVTFDDVLALLSSWGECFGCPADLDGSGSVDFTDLLNVLSAFNL